MSEVIIKKIQIMLLIAMIVLALKQLARELGERAIDRGVYISVLGNEVRIGDLPPLAPKVEPQPIRIDQWKPKIQQGLSAVTKAVKAPIVSPAAKAKTKSSAPPPPTSAP